MHGRPVICSDIGGMAEKVTRRRRRAALPRRRRRAASRDASAAQPHAGLWERLRSGIRARLSDGRARRRASKRSTTSCCATATVADVGRAAAPRHDSRRRLPAAMSSDVRPGGAESSALLADGRAAAPRVLVFRLDERTAMERRLLADERMARCPVGRAWPSTPRAMGRRLVARCAWTTPRSVGSAIGTRLHASSDRRDSCSSDDSDRS